MRAYTFSQLNDKKQQFPCLRHILDCYAHELIAFKTEP